MTRIWLAVRKDGVMGVLSDGEISRRSGVSRSVVREMRRRMRVPAARVHRFSNQGVTRG